MSEPNYRICLEETLTKAFACGDQKARLAYLQLADFYDRQAQKQAMRDKRGPVRIFR